ncbi:hypothetical protein C1H46_012470 [Malus baccata]|uniref:Uncharacterized protein n=1 Tax=Malus baccata TaxID=106549 RepID=A0A540MSR3_MALBA|nr:hypothetical protein C1H46_012470 [Malus baccata]
MAMVQITCDPFKRQKLLLVVVEISAMVVGMRDMLSQHSSSSTSMTPTYSYKNFLKYIYLLPIPSFREYRGCSLSNQFHPSRWPNFPPMNLNSTFSYDLVAAPNCSNDV